MKYASGKVIDLLAWVDFAKVPKVVQTFKFLGCLSHRCDV
jgi:hypothetical protein